MNRYFPPRRCVLPALCLVLAGALAGCQSNAYLRQRALERIEIGRFDLAEPYVRQAVQQEASDWRAKYYLGMCQVQLGQPMQAQMLLEQAAAMAHDQPELPDIHDQIAEALYQQKQHEPLVGFLQQTASTHLRTRDFLRQARYLGRIGDADGSTLALQKAAKVAGTKDPEPYIALGDYLLSIGDAPRAALNYRRAYYILPGFPGLEGRLVKVGVVPGPTAGLPPEE